MVSEAEAIGGRLKEALVARGLTQGELAKRLGVSSAAVSAWISGAKPPSKANLAAAAAVLHVQPEWLLFGRGEGPAVDLDAERVEYRDQVGWRFRPAPADGGRDYGNANVWAFDPTIWVMVRDIIQNSRDAVLMGTKQVQVTFKIVRLRGRHLQEFQKAVAWDQLAPHLEASAQIDQRLGRLIKHNLDALAEKRELLLLVVDDRGTSGLLGEEDGEGNFAALVRNNLDSNKQSGTAGGAFGLGKAVLWRMSSFSLVLFGSNLSVPTGDGLRYRRIMGRCDLPWHGNDEENRFAGPGWFGRINEDSEHGERTVSYWDNEALAHDLYLSRGEDIGTSVCIVGFHDPSSEEDRTPPDMAREIKAAVADCFWPDLARGQLRVAVDIYEGPDRISGGEVSADEYREEFVDAFRKWMEDEDLVEELKRPGDVVAVPVPLNYPKRRADPTHPNGTHEAVLLVRYAETDGSDHSSGDRRLNELAMFRGVGMVVQYLPLKGICMGALPFHAALLCGEGAARPDEEPESASREADRFLRTAEPPNHDRWTSTPDLGTEYFRPGRKAIDDFIATAKDMIRNLVRPLPDELSDGPNALKELLKIGEEEDVHIRPRIHRPTGILRDDGSWSVSARIRVKPGDSRWRVQPVIVFEQESGGGAVVDWKSLEPENNCSIDESGRLVIAPNVREASFKGTSDPQSHPIDARESSITIDLRKCELVEEGVRA